MRTIWPFALACMLVAVSCPGAENPITNGGFEAGEVNGKPADWETLGSVRLVADAHSGKAAALLERTAAGGGECGLNRTWQPDSGRQDMMLSALKGGVRFWYKAEVSSGPSSLTFYLIAMSGDPMENTGEPRAAFRVPPDHVGDGRWHEGVLKYDFRGSDKARWVQVSPRLTGEKARLLLDDITWVEHVGPLASLTQVQMEEVTGKEGQECMVRALVKNIGDQPIGIGMGAIELPPGLTPQGGALRNLQALAPDETAPLSWRVTGARVDRGRIGLNFTVGDSRTTATLEYAAGLEVAGFVADEFIVSPAQPTRVTLRLRNTGHATARAVTAELRPGVPLTTPTERRKQGLTEIAPQTMAALTWEVTGEKQSPAAPVRCVVNAANAEAGRAETALIVAAPSPTREPPAVPVGVNADAACADIGNDRVRLRFPWSEFGYGVGLVQRRVGTQWQTVAKLPRISRLVVRTPEAGPAEHLVYAQEVREIPSPEAVAPAMLTRKLALIAKLTDASNTSWTITETISLRPTADIFRLELEAVPDGPAVVVALEGPMVCVGEGAPAGTRRLDALFPGLEWLVEGEESSSALDIAPDHPHRLRVVPPPHMVTIPLMAVRLAPPVGERALVALLWDHLEPYCGKLNRPSAVFASPDRFAGHASSLLGLFAPSMPEYIEANQREARVPLAVKGGEPVRLGASLLVRTTAPDATALEAVKVWVGEHRVPEPRPLPHGKTWADEIQFSMAAYLRSLWIPEAGKWWPYRGGPALNMKPGWPPSYLYDMRMCLEACPDSPVRQEVRARYDEVVASSHLQPAAEDAGFHYAGPADSLLGQAETVSALIRQMGEDGAWRFRARIETQGVFKGKDYAELGKDGEAEIGTCARNAWTIMRFARMTGDKAARQAGLKALAFMDRFEVPRAAQVWEVPVHTPDILASADACEAYLEAYQLTGEKRHLDRAVYWAWTGLPFVYLWDVEGFEFLRYASIPVFGASWFGCSWFGRPVQWNGLRYAYALTQLAPLDPATDWARIARGITTSCLYQQSTDPEDEAMWPDSISALDKGKSGWIFAPHPILHNVYAHMGMQPTPVTATARIGLDDVRISAAGKVSDARFDLGTLTCTVTFTAPQTGYVMVCNVSRPRRVRVNGEVATEAPLPREAPAPAWRYLDQAGVLEVRLKGSGQHRLELSDVTFVHKSFEVPLAETIAFNFDAEAEGWRPAHHLSAFRVADGILHTETIGEDPYLVRSNCQVPAAGVRQLHLRMALAPGQGTGAQFFWATAAEGTMDEPKSQHFPVIADGAFHEYTIPLATHARWQGTITAIRLDPTGGPQPGEVSIDYIRGE